MVQRYPIARLIAATGGNQTIDAYSKDVALLPAGLHSKNWLTSPLANMNHLLRDHLIHEADIIRRAERSSDGNVTVVLGEDFSRKWPFNFVHHLRAKLFADTGAVFRPKAGSRVEDAGLCFRR